MNQFKPWWTSTGVWGGAVAVAAPLLGIVGFPLTPADMQSTASLLVTGAEVVGGLLAVYGRVVATKKIG